jgi:hypothetical protein
MSEVALLALATLMSASRSGGRRPAVAHRPLFKSTCATGAARASKLIKLLPMNIQVESNKNIVYKSYHEVSVALADHDRINRIPIDVFRTNSSQKYADQHFELVSSSAITAGGRHGNVSCTRF